MPRTARARSTVGLYHVLLRGAEGRMIFADDQDCARFLDSLSHAREGDAFLLYAYCLMGTHAHLLIREASVPLETAFKRIGASYARYYNTRYNQTGRLFQDRFQSEPLNDNPHFLDAMRFICQNPVKAGLSKNMFSYPWLGCSGVTESRDLLYSPDVMKEEKRRELVTFLRAPRRQLPARRDRLPREAKTQCHPPHGPRCRPFHSPACSPHRSGQDRC